MFQVCFITLTNQKPGNLILISYYLILFSRDQEVLVFSALGGFFLTKEKRYCCCYHLKGRHHLYCAPFLVTVLLLPPVSPLILQQHVFLHFSCKNKSIISDEINLGVNLQYIKKPMFQVCFIALTNLELGNLI